MSKMRIAAVTAGLVLAGGVFGAIAGTLVLMVWQLRIDGLAGSWAAMGWCVVFGVFFGGGFGALLGPLAAWVLMRHVPLWLAVGGTTLGTFASGALVMAISGNPVIALYVGFIGFMLTAAALHDRFPPEGRRPILKGDLR
ncbi:MAG TPA: hypothetical protein VFT45_27330 [Longimicrobium sp.]|nr:hypothetical protein [Longimicrobium sp.]